MFRLTTFRWTIPASLLFILSVTASAEAEPFPRPPEDFPRFIVPAYQQPMDSLRILFHHHHQPPAGPLATLWDQWMSGSTLWPAVKTNHRHQQLRDRWRDVLSGRQIDPEGYVATHQHASIAHQQGWPFPFWRQGGPDSWGWHFSLPPNLPPVWHNTEPKTQEGWEIIDGEDLGIENGTWNIALSRNGTRVLTPEISITPLQSPFIQLRWQAQGLERAHPYLEWTTREHPEFSPQRRFYFEPAGNDRKLTFTMIPVFKSPQWTGEITRLAINFDHAAEDGQANIQALFTQYDTRHAVNNQCFIRGSCEYFWWSGDFNFLRDNIQRMRFALHYLMTEMGGREQYCIVVPFVGHDGISGLKLKENGGKELLYGHGVGHNYWDLLPCGRQTTFATIYYYDTLNYMARLEREINDHPEWNIPAGPHAFDPDDLRQHAAEVKEYANTHFWNEQTGRFVLGLDDHGEFHDYGHTSVSLEAIAHGLATDEHARQVLSWLDGERIIEGDTSTGEDIYHWRFAPRATTRRNIEWYGWYWNGPETIPFGGQVQDGGAVLGFSYHDLMSRLMHQGPDDAWKRLREIITWFDEVRQAGGYRAYYADSKNGGSLQGGGTPGGLGLDKEFYESILVPQVMLNGFLGFSPRGDGFELRPQLPSAWPSLTITRIAYQDLVLEITAEEEGLTIKSEGSQIRPLQVYVAPGQYQVQYLDSQGHRVGETEAFTIQEAGGIPARLGEGREMKIMRQ